MAFTKTRADADQYFSPKNHIKALDWAGFDEDERDGAFAQAKRELETWLGRQLEDPTSGVTGRTDLTQRDDYALYEQALFILEKTPRTRPAGAAKEITDADEDEEDIVDRTGVTISPMARNYLQASRIKMVRG